MALDTDRRYELISMDVNRAWKRDDDAHAFDLNIGATDDLRFAMSMSTSGVRERQRQTMSRVSTVARTGMPTGPPTSV